MSKPPIKLQNLIHDEILVTSSTGKEVTDYWNLFRNAKLEGLGSVRTNWSFDPRLTWEEVVGMGTDIHLNLEWRVPTRTDEAFRKAIREGNLSSVSKWLWFEKSDYGKIADEGLDYYIRFWKNPITGEDTDILIEDDRHYELFGLLSNVRHQSVKMLCPLSQYNGNGIPDDVSNPNYRGEVEHTPCWMTIEQLLQHDWPKEGPCQCVDFYKMLVSLRDRFPDMDGNHTGKDLRLLFYFDS